MNPMRGLIRVTWHDKYFNGRLIDVKQAKGIYSYLQPIVLDGKLPAVCGLTIDRH